MSSAKYIANYAKNVLHKPCVISISLGSDLGPHDGTSNICLAYQQIAEQYGAIILLAVGNEGNITGTASKTLTSDNDYLAVSHTLNYGSSYGGDCDIWNSTGDELQVKIIVNGTESDWMSRGTFNNITVQGELSAANGRYQMYIANTSGNATYIIKGKGGNKIEVYTDCFYSQLSSNSSNVSGYIVTPGTYENSMCDDMTSPKVISVGAICTRNTYNGSYLMNDIAYFSSYGTDYNGVNHPFITANGHYVISSINGYNSGETATWSTNFNGTTYKWGQMSGTSMATPCAAGVVALYLQADPSLDVDRVKEVIAETATPYINPASTPKQRGHGIINALAGIEFILQHQGPTIAAKPSEINFDGYAGETYTNTITIKGYNLTGPISIAKSGSNAFAVSATTISAEDARNGVDVTVTYAPTAAGNTIATLILTSPDAEPVTVTLAGVAQPRVPTLLTDPESLSFSSKLNKPVSKTISVTGLFLTNDITVTLTDPSNVFTVSPTTIAKGSTGIDTPVDVTVTFVSATEGTFDGTITFTSNGASSKTVHLQGKASDLGTATDPFLDITKYATIDEAGATVSGMSSIYNYTELDDCGWLTISNYGVIKTDATQEWFTNDITKTGSGSWQAADVFPGSNRYFGAGTAYYADWNEAYQTFYVTNCSQVKQYAYHYSSSGYYMYMRIYECTLNNDGTITAGTTAVQTKTNNGSGNEIVTSDDLDPDKIYKITIYNDYSKLYEIGFKTNLDVPMLKASPSQLVMTANPGESKTFTINVTANKLPGDVNVTLNDPDGVFSVSTDKITKADAEAGTQLTVTFKSVDEGSFSGTITLTSGNLTATVDLAAMSNNGGTASDKYLNIAKCATIDEAGATVEGMEKIYTFTELNDEDCAWLTVSNYGAARTDATQEWIVNSLTATAARAWTASDVFQGSEPYFGTSQSYGMDWNGYYQRYYVTNCLQVKQLTFNRSASWPLHMRTYECNENIDGTLTPVTPAVDEQQSVTINRLEVLTTGELDPNKIYLVEIYNDYSYLYEIAFKTPLVKGVFGDVDGDGYVTASDITAIYNYMLNDDTTYIETSDINGDGEITSSDVTIIYNILLETKKFNLDIR